MVVFVCRLHQFGVRCGLGPHSCEMSVCIRCVKYCRLPLLQMCQTGPSDASEVVTQYYSYVSNGVCLGLRRNRWEGVESIT